MGMSKAMMEKVAVAKSRNLAEGETTICVTRYGNVMASRGSVIPLFISQIKSGKPITITDPDMTRFMMSLDDAVDLVLFAFKHGQGGDTLRAEGAGGDDRTAGAGAEGGVQGARPRSASSAPATARRSTRRCSTGRRWSGRRIWGSITGLARMPGI